MPKMTRSLAACLIAFFIALSVVHCRKSDAAIQEMQLVSRTNWVFPLGTDSVGSFTPWILYRGILLHDSLVYFGDPEFQRLNALNLQTGQVHWGRKGALPRRIDGFALVADRIVAPTDTGVMYLNKNLEQSTLIEVPDIDRPLRFSSVTQDSAILIGDATEWRSDSLWYIFGIIAVAGPSGGLSITRQLLDSATTPYDAVHISAGSLRRRMYYLFWNAINGKSVDVDTINQKPWLRTGSSHFPIPDELNSVDIQERIDFDNNRVVFYTIDRENALYPCVETVS